jgi:pimeloyl-ACP methyl ester carboxylesterase
MRTRRVVVDGTTLVVHEWGGGDAPAVLFWHAIGDHTGLQMAEAAPILAERHGLRVAALDAPGFGASPALDPDDAERLTLASVAPLATAAADALGLERPVFAGASWGGAVALAAAGLQPERLRGVALLDFGYQPVRDTGESLSDLRAHWRAQEGFRHPSWAAWRKDAKAYFRRYTEALDEALRAGFREEDGEVVSIMGPDLYATVVWALRRDPPTRYFDAVAASGLPVLLLVAAEPAETRADREGHIAEFTARVPQTEVVQVEGARHQLLEDDPEQVAALLGSWAARLYA